MTDLKARFRDLDALGDPDVWERVGSARPPTGFKLRQREAKRWAVAVFAILVAGAAIAFAAQAFLTTRPAGVGGWTAYEDPGRLWHLSYPASWYVQPFGEDQGTFRGVLISNVNFLFRHPHPQGYGTTAWDMLGLPAEAVVVQVQLSDFGPAAPRPPWTHFPISLAKAQSVTDHPAFGAPQPRLFLPLNVRHQPHNY
jgi:hypothetical protein